MPATVLSPSRRAAVILVLIATALLAGRRPAVVGARGSDAPAPALPVVQGAAPGSGPPGCSHAGGGWTLVNPLGGDLYGEGQLTLADGYAADACHLVLVGEVERRSPTAPRGCYGATTTGVVAHSDDGGATLRVTELPRMQSIDHVAFADDRHGWATGLPGADLSACRNHGSGLLRTDDGGETWTDVALPDQQPPPRWCGSPRDGCGSGSWMRRG